MQLRQEEVAVVVLNKKITFAQSIFAPAASDDGRAFARNAVGVFQIVEDKFRGVRNRSFSVVYFPANHEFLKSPEYLQKSLKLLVFTPGTFATFGSL